MITIKVVSSKTKNPVVGVTVSCSGKGIPSQAQTTDKKGCIAYSLNSSVGDVRVIIAGKHRIPDVFLSRSGINTIEINE